jgi:hypothetical protein
MIPAHLGRWAKNMTSALIITPETCKEITVPFMTALADWLRPDETITIEWRGPDYHLFTKETEVLFGLFSSKTTEERGSRFTYITKGKRGFLAEATKYVSEMIREQIRQVHIPNNGSVVYQGPIVHISPLRTIPVTDVVVDKNSI